MGSTRTPIAYARPGLREAFGRLEKAPHALARGRQVDRVADQQQSPRPAGSTPATVAFDSPSAWITVAGRPMAEGLSCGMPASWLSLPPMAVILRPRFSCASQKGAG